ncbi:hypothetical protein GGR50DRAFT_650945 [Xylaria sp. CBS 124048]|nr:hypothetical protein GGR50DRAFT_650945 [Xylaria sp. CBS 124048]
MLSFSPYKNPFVKLGVRPILLFRFGTSIPVPLTLIVSSPSYTLGAVLIRLTLLEPPSKVGVPKRTPPPFTVPFSIRKCFHPSNSRSSRDDLSLSSRNSRSALRVASWFVLSLVWRSPMVLRRFSILSRNLVTSSLN